MQRAFSSDIDVIRRECDLCMVMFMFMFMFMMMLKLVHARARIQTANSTRAGRFVENIGPWFEVKTMATSVHGDIGHSKGFHQAEGISEVCTLRFVT